MWARALYLDSLLFIVYVDALFTKIYLDETIDICFNQLSETTDTVESFRESELKQLLSLATKESYFIFNSLLYKQIDVAAIGSPLRPPIANAFLLYHGKRNWLNHFPEGFKPVSTDVLLMTFFCSSNRIIT